MIFVAQLLREENSLELLFDEAGLELLKNVINKHWTEPIQKHNDLYDLDHEHLTSKEWGGNELTPEYTSKEYDKVHSIKIVYLGKNAEKLLT